MPALVYNSVLLHDANYTESIVSREAASALFMSEKTKMETGAVQSHQPDSTTGQAPSGAGPRLPEPETPVPSRDDRWLVPGVCLFLAAIIWLVFGQTLGHEFVNYDDQIYVYENPAVTAGLTFHGIVWAFTHVHSSNWHPLTWISHMLDCQIYGLDAGGHHLTNVLLHTVTVILLFLVLWRMTGLRANNSPRSSPSSPPEGTGSKTTAETASARQAGDTLWRSAFVAAVFAIHPLRVESVAWVAERKDVLSGLFFVLTLLAWVQYVKKSTVHSPQSTVHGPQSTVFYDLALVCFALGLMCKPMLVTLPLVLLLLDYWPLNRFTIYDTDSGRVLAIHRSLRFTIWPLIREKLPFIGLAIASCAITIYAQRGALQSLEQFPLPLRAGNALIACVAYMRQMFWPSGLAAVYPLAAANVTAARVALSLVLLAAITTGVLNLRRYPYFLTGWLWYLIMLLPVIGIVQVGIQARADRYTYLPQIGLYLLVTWAAADLTIGWRHRRVMLGGGAAIILVALVLCARAQTSCWRNSEVLWRHTLARTSDNAMAESNLGNALLQEGSVDEAIAHYQNALQIKPDYLDVHVRLASALFQKGEVDEAIAHYQTALQLKPGYAEVHNNLGCALLQIGKVDEAIAHCRKALQIKPGYVNAHINLGNALFQKGEVDEAIAQYQKALQIEPDSTTAHNCLDYALLLKDKSSEALTDCQKVLQTQPDSPVALNNLAWLLATCPDARIRDGVQAVRHAERACAITHYGVTLHVGTLAAAYAEAGRFEDAIAAGEKACALASAANESDLLETNRQLLAWYRTRRPYHETAEQFISTLARH